MPAVRFDRFMKKKPDKKSHTQGGQVFLSLSEKAPCLSHWERWPAIAGRRGFRYFVKNPRILDFCITNIRHPPQSCARITSAQKEKPGDSEDPVF